MDEPLTDDRIAYIIAANATAYVDPVLLAALSEIQQHRARVAAHATTHPERLSDEELGSIAGGYIGTRHLGDRRLRLMVSEIQRRRAYDLTPADLEHVRTARRLARCSELSCSPAAALANGYRQAVDVIDKILHAHGATP